MVLADTPRPDVVIADFEGETYAPWIVEGEAFGAGPAKGTFPRQNPVTGFEGKGLVNSYGEADRLTGRLISPDFTIDRPYLNLLIGGGGFEEKVYISLFVDGKEVRHSTGWNTSAGGSEALLPIHWDLRDFVGKTGRIEIVDNATGGWGHLNVDSIVLSDTPRGERSMMKVCVEKSKAFHPTKRFLLVPISKNEEARRTYLRVEADGEWVREMTLQLSESPEDVLFYGTIEVAPWSGKEIRLIAERVAEDSDVLDRVVESDEPGDYRIAYQEKYRPQFHFAPRRGWTNDPNGLFFYKGTYHLFYQHNPFSTRWGNMTWGHATSPDLIHWTEGTDIFWPDKLGTIFSGSGVVDEKNTSGLAPEGNPDPPLVVFFTSNGPEARPPVPVTQSMGYSLDGGKTWTKYPKNPIVPHMIGGNRDPKVFWYEPTGSWIMALYLDGEDYALFRSKNLIDWEMTCKIERLGCSECPDMFELAVDGDENNKKWVFWGGNGNYLIGSFDGETFTKEAGPFQSKYGGNDYAAQTYYQLPDNRRIQFSWMNGGEYPGMPFNQQLTVPRELTLKTTPDGVRLAFAPVAELETLRAEPIALVTQDEKIRKESVEFGDLPECFDALMTLDVSGTKKVTFSFLSRTIEYDVEAGLLNGVAPLKPQGGKITIRFVVDRMSYEIFAADGVTEFAECFVPDDASLADGQAGRGKFTISSEPNGSIGVESLAIYPLRSIW